MKNPALSALILIATLSAAFAQKDPRAGHGAQFIPKDVPAAVRETMTDQQLLKLREQQGVKKADTGVKRETWDLESNSEFIVSEKVVTLVPKGAILYVPDRFRQNIAPNLSGSFLIWNEFLAKYRGLVTSFEVTLDQATGEKPLDAARFEAAKKSGLIIVAVLNRSPISVSQPAVTTNPAK
jgi:hypothetical protein